MDTYTVTITRKNNILVYARDEQEAIEKALYNTDESAFICDTKIKKLDETEIVSALDEATQVILPKQ